MNIQNFEIEIKRHAFIRATQRGITPDMIEATLKGGKIERFGKHNVRFIKDYKKSTVICVGQMIGTKIKIFTIETKGAKKS